jgi:hypothetical protein
MQEATFDPPSSNKKLSKKDSFDSDCLKKSNDLSAKNCSDSNHSLDNNNNNSVDTGSVHQRSSQTNINAFLSGAAKGAASAAKVTAKGAASAAKVTAKGATLPIKQVKAMQALAGPSRDHTPKTGSISNKHDANSMLKSSSQHGKSSLLDDEENNRTNGSSATKNEREESNNALLSTATKVITTPITAPLNALKYASSTLVATTDWMDGTPALHAMLDARLSSYRRIM